MTLGMDVWVGYLTLCGIACPWMQAQRTLADDPVDSNTAWHCLLATESRQNSLAVCGLQKQPVSFRSIYFTGHRTLSDICKGLSRSTHGNSCRTLYVGLCDMFPMTYTVNVTI